MKIVRIGSGAGYSGDRIEPAVELAEKGDIAYLGFECLGERTVAIAQDLKLKDPSQGYDPLLVDRMEAVLGLCAKRGIKIITNMGAANPIGAGAAVAEVAKRLGISGLKIAMITGDDVIETIRAGDLPLIETTGTVGSVADRMVSANAYLGVAPIVEALENGADIVITGRVSDPALFLAPLVYEFGWKLDDWQLMGQGTVIGHLLECAGQITGGYFADPGFKDVAGLARLGFPIAEVSEDGTAVMTKVLGSGGQVTTRTCKEQLLYEIHDPTRYLTPDVVADFSGVRFKEIAPDRVAVSGGSGTERPPTLKVSIGYIDSYIGEGQISYAGPGAAARGQLALDIVTERLKIMGVKTTELRAELIGVNSIYKGTSSAANTEPMDVRVRVADLTETMKEAIRIGNEVETLYTNGPAGGGGTTRSAKRVLGIVSTLLPREAVQYAVTYGTT